MRFEFLYWIIVSLAFVYIIYKYRYNAFFVLIILFYFEGVFTFFGSLTWNFYKVFLLAYALYCYIKYKGAISNPPRIRLSLFLFAIFSLVFTLSSLVNNDPLLLFFNQYSRYLYGIISLVIISAFNKRHHSIEPINDLVYFLLKAQIVFSIINYLLMGIHENTVGSISSNGGSAATVIPVLGILWYWHYKKGVFRQKEWLFIIGLLFIGFVSVKRAIWIVAPAFLFLLMFYVPKRKINPRLLLLIPIAPLIFYLGVRLNPTFNREHTVWGSFDFDYFFDYANGYTFGHEKESIIEYGEKIYAGRGGATILTFERIFSGDKPLSFLGNGLKNMYAYDFNSLENMEAPMKINELNSVTMATGFFQNYYTGGVLLILSFWLYMLSLFSIIKKQRLFVVILVYFAWEYFLYANVSIRTPATSFLFILIVILFSSQNNTNAKTVNHLS